MIAVPWTSKTVQLGASLALFPGHCLAGKLGGAWDDECDPGPRGLLLRVHCGWPWVCYMAWPLYECGV